MVWAEEDRKSMDVLKGLSFCNAGEMKPDKWKLSIACV